jgi:hypothetical protein
MKIDDLTDGDRVIFRDQPKISMGIFRKKVECILDIEELTASVQLLLCQFHNEPYLRAFHPEQLVVVDDIDV